MDGGTGIPSLLGLLLVLVDENDVFTTILQPFGEAATDATAAHDDDAHWEYLECLCDVPGETTLEDYRRQDDQKHRPDQDRCRFRIRRAELEREEGRHARRDDTSRADCAHEQSLADRKSVPVRTDQDGDGSDHRHDGEDDQEAPETERQEVLEREERRERDEHEREDDQRDIPLERLDLLLARDIEVPEENPGSRDRSDTRFRCDLLGDSVGRDRSDEDDQPRVPDCLRRGEIDVSG